MIRVCSSSYIEATNFINSINVVNSPSRLIFDMFVDNQRVGHLALCKIADKKVRIYPNLMSLTQCFLSMLCVL